MLKAIPTVFFRNRRVAFFLLFCALFFFPNLGFGVSSISSVLPPTFSPSPENLVQKSSENNVLVEKRHKHSRSHSSKKKTRKEANKVLFIVPHLVIGGLDRAFTDMLRFLPRKTTEYDVCILHRGGAFEALLPAKTKIISLKKAQRSTYGTVVSYAHWIDPALWVGRVRAKRYVQWLHADLSTIGGTIPLHKKKGRKGIDYFVGVSKAASKSLLEISKSFRKRTLTIHNCIDEDEIVYKSQTAQNEIVSDGKMVNVVTVARFTAEKGIPRLIKVHGKLNKKGINFRWYFLGSGPDQKECERLVHEEGLEGKVFFLGYKMNPYPYMKAADLNVLGSYSESWGLVITEAMILHRPVLSTEVGGSREQILSGKNGLIVPNSEDGLVEGLKDLILNEETRNSFARNLANFHYDNKTIINQLEELLYPDSYTTRYRLGRRSSHSRSRSGSHSSSTSHSRSRSDRKRKDVSCCEGLTTEQQIVQDKSLQNQW